MKENIIKHRATKENIVNHLNEQIYDMLNMLDETGEFSLARLERLSKDPETLFKVCLEWEGIIGFESQIQEWAKGLFKALPSLLYDDDDENPFELLDKKDEEIAYLVNCLTDSQREDFNKWKEERNNG